MEIVSRRLMMSLKLTLFICILVIPMIFFFTGSIMAISPEEILEENYNRQGLGQGSFVMEIKAISYNGEESNTADIKVYLYDKERQIITFTAPQWLRDDSYLVVGYNTWMYRQGLHRPIRISARQKLFGDAGIAETVGINYLHDYKVVKMSEDDLWYVMELTALDKKTAYQQAKLWVTKDGLHLRRAVLKALNGQSLKELDYSNYHQIDGHEVATIVIKNLLYEKDHKTEIDFISIRNRELPVEAFQPLMMGKFKLLVKD